MASLPAVPTNLKAIQHYLKTAQEHDKRDPVISYYCRLYAMQKGMEIDKTTPECRTFLVSLMDYLEQVKKASEEEAISTEVVGQAHVENYALKVFLYADNEDRSSRFNKNVVKSFYTAGMLFDVLSVFGEIGEDVEKNRKYAKWKAAYIHKCLKNGETPVPGPMPEEGDEFGEEVAPVLPPTQPNPSAYVPPPQQPGASMPTPQQPPNYGNLNLPTPNSAYPAGGTHAPPTTPQQQDVWTPPPNPGGVQLGNAEYQRAAKLCKFAISAIQYEDSASAIDNLTKALKLLTTGKES